MKSFCWSLSIFLFIFTYGLWKQIFGFNILPLLFTSWVTLAMWFNFSVS